MRSPLEWVPGLSYVTKRPSTAKRSSTSTKKLFIYVILTYDTCFFHEESIEMGPRHVGYASRRPSTTSRTLGKKLLIFVNLKYDICFYPIISSLRTGQLSDMLLGPISIYSSWKNMVKTCIICKDYKHNLLADTPRLRFSRSWRVS